MESMNRGGKKPFSCLVGALEHGNSGLQAWEDPGCLTEDTCCPHSAFGWMWLPACACILPLWRWPMRWGCSQELCLWWLVLVSTL